MQDKIFTAQRDILINFADKQSCIIVGRCADYILRYHPRHMNVYIYASVEDRYDNCVNVLGMDPDEARQMIADVDKSRSAYHKKYTGYTQDNPNYQDIMMNSSLLGVEGTAQLLANAVRKKFVVEEKI